MTSTAKIKSAARERPTVRGRTRGIPTLYTLYARPGFLLPRAHQIAVGIFVQECAAFELPPSTQRALIAIGQCPGLDQAALARAIGFDRATIGKVVEGMEKRGLLWRENSERDRRRMALALTPQGRMLMKRATPAIPPAQT